MKNTDLTASNLKGTNEHKNRFFNTPYDVKNEKLKDKPKDFLRNSELF
ncbi:hypothetical protein SDC9_160804 [bioreactor metagenome]|uniref:Uncharacterized protein n=1 Tax=bioreactor metagenome TaxID=1076179 RepID=A0A645FMQ6_9ZZZZ